MAPTLRFVAAIALAVMALTGCRQATTQPKAAAPPLVVVSMPVLRGIVGSMFAPECQIGVLLPRAERSGPLSPEAQSLLDRSDLVVTMGLPVEQQISERLNGARSPRRVVVSLGPELAGEESRDASIMLDPLAVKRALPAIRDGAIATLRRTGRPEDESHVSGMTAVYEELCDHFDAQYREQLAPFRGRTIVTNSDALGAFAARYGLKVAAVLQPLESGAPTPEQVAACIAAVREHGEPVVFLEPWLARDVVIAFARDANVRLEMLDPEGISAPWWPLMENNLAALVRGFSQPDAGQRPLNSASGT